MCIILFLFHITSTWNSVVSIPVPELGFIMATVFKVRCVEVKFTQIKIHPFMAQLWEFDSHVSHVITITVKV